LETSNDSPAGMPTPLTTEKFKDVIVVIPAYNEELVIGTVVLKVCQVVERVIVVDDGSQDNTAEVARLAGAEVIRIDENQGKAHALLIGLKRVRELGCRAAVTFDGDAQHKSHDISTVIKPVLEGKADLVIGSRFLTKSNGVPSHRRVGQKTLDIFTQIGSQHPCTDSQSGFRALSSKALENLDFTSYGYGIESDMITHFAERGLILAEVPITVRYEVPHGHNKNFLARGLGVLADVPKCRGGITAENAGCTATIIQLGEVTNSLISLFESNTGNLAVDAARRYGKCDYVPEKTEYHKSTSYPTIRTGTVKTDA